MCKADCVVQQGVKRRGDQMDTLQPETEDGRCGVRGVSEFESVRSSAIDCVHVHKTSHTSSHTSDASKETNPLSKCSGAVKGVRNGSSLSNFSGGTPVYACTQFRKIPCEATVERHSESVQMGLMQPAEHHWHCCHDSDTRFAPLAATRRICSISVPERWPIGG